MEVTMNTKPLTFASSPRCPCSSTLSAAFSVPSSIVRRRCVAASVARSGAIAASIVRPRSALFELVLRLELELVVVGELF